jgi:hypothetical protein
MLAGRYDNPVLESGTKGPHCLLAQDASLHQYIFLLCDLPPSRLPFFLVTDYLQSYISVKEVASTLKGTVSRDFLLQVFS